MITQAQAQKVCKKKDHLHGHFIDNGYHMPENVKHSFVTEKMLIEMYLKQCMVIKKDEIKFQTCRFPPSANVLRDECCNAIDMHNYGEDDQARNKW